VVTGLAVTGATPQRALLELRHHGGVLVARGALLFAGAWSDRLAVAAGASPDPRIVPFRGAYRLLAPERRHLVRGLVYPVPDPRLPFLGVHLTRHVDGEVSVGPTALLVCARDAYRLRDVRMRDLAETLAWPGTWRLAWRFRATALGEVARALRPARLASDAARYVPELTPADLRPGPAGVRAQALGRDGALLDDFAFSETERALHVRNAPSPAATSALAIARVLADRLLARTLDGR
jgi:2-hydroxyglutarate dehydrogenase